MLKTMIKKFIASNSYTKVAFIKFQNARRKFTDSTASDLSKISSTSHHSNVFDFIYQKRFWRAGESISGYGSTLSMTEKLRPQLEKMLKDLEIKSFLDLPCGDFNWMRTVNFGNIKYIGGEIVQDLVNDLNQKYQTENITFKKLDLVSDSLPSVDMIFIRDCLIHLKNDLVVAALKNVAKTNVKYVCITHSPQTMLNTDIETGQFREVNLCRSPFNLPEPFILMNEGLTDPLTKDKAMGIWKISDFSHFRQ